MRKRVTIVILAMTLLLPTVACSGQLLSPDDAIGLARGLVAQLVAGDFADAFNSFDSTMKTALPPDALEDAWHSLLEQAGPYSHELAVSYETGGKLVRVLLTSMFEKFALNIQITYNQKKQVMNLLFLPAQGYGYTAPSYADSNLFVEEDITITTGSYSLDGTFTVPGGEGPWPAVVLVHGSGPNDRDETVGGNKPFADLAWGLASRGIAVLRYDKRTLVYGREMASMPNITLQEETVEDAITAVQTLRGVDKIDMDRIFVLGHSLGGMAAPRIGKALPDLAGIIILAGPARPLEDLILEQTTYLVSLQDPSPELDEHINTIRSQVEMVKSTNLNPATPPSQLPYGLPAPYWLDLRGYEPALVANSLDIPMLILQGARDHQVTMEDFQIWQNSLGTRQDVTFKSYPSLNHLFITGEGKSVPDEYMRAGNIEIVVIDDIAAWINE